MKTMIMSAAENDRFAKEFDLAPESVASLMHYFEGALATPSGRAALLTNPEEFVKAEVSRWNDLCGNWLRELAEMKTPPRHPCARTNCEGCLGSLDLTKVTSPLVAHGIRGHLAKCFANLGAQNDVLPRNGRSCRP